MRGIKENFRGGSSGGGGVGGGQFDIVAPSSSSFLFHHVCPRTLRFLSRLFFSQLLPRPDPKGKTEEVRSTRPHICSGLTNMAAAHGVGPSVTSILVGCINNNICLPG